MKATGLCILLILTGLSPLEGTATATGSEPARFDVLVFAPHPDDEVLGCAGAMSRALEEQKRVGVVVLTNGDGYPKAASVVTNKPQDQLIATDFLKLAAARQQQSIDGMAHVGVHSDDLTFLGYPDSGLEEIYRAREGTVYRQKFTGKNQTYGSVVSDYHSLVHGRPAPYTRASLIGDIVEIIKARRPTEIYVTHEVDTHSDHKAAFWFVRDAARVAQFRGAFYTYVNHGNTQPELPSRRVTLTPVHLKTKRLAIREHQIPVVHDHLQSYATSEELFWEISLG